MNADKIYVLEKGGISEVGSHDELLHQKGLYYAMWSQQIGERKIKVTREDALQPGLVPVSEPEYLTNGND